MAPTQDETSIIYSLRIEVQNGDVPSVAERGEIHTQDVSHSRALTVEHCSVAGRLAA